LAFKRKRKTPVSIFHVFLQLPSCSLAAYPLTTAIRRIAIPFRRKGHKAKPLPLRRPSLQAIHRCLSRQASRLRFGLRRMAVPGRHSFSLRRSCSALDSSRNDRLGPMMGHVSEHSTGALAAAKCEFSKMGQRVIPKRCSNGYSSDQRQGSCATGILLRPMAILDVVTGTG